MKIAATALMLSACAFGQTQVVISGLQTPNKIILTAAGNLLVSETSLNPNSGRISLVTRAGVQRVLFENLPSGTEVVGGASGPTAMALRERTLYVAIGAGDSERRAPAPSIARIHNPQGISSPLFASVLEFRFSRDLDAVTGPFRVTTQNQQALADGGEIELADGSGSTVRASVLARFPIAEPSPVTVYKFSNLWGLALSEDGLTLFVADASGDHVTRVDTSSGRWRRVARFPPIPNPTPVGPPVVDPVPTSVRLYDNLLLVSFLSGFPFASGSARVLAVNPEDGSAQPFIFGLTSATDVFVAPAFQRHVGVLRAGIQHQSECAAAPAGPAAALSEP